MAGASFYNFLIAISVTVGAYTYGFNNSVIAPVYGEIWLFILAVQVAGTDVTLRNASFLSVLWPFS